MTNVEVATSVTYSGGVAVFIEQIGIQPTTDNVGMFSGEGDSGSSVLNDKA